MAMASPTDFIGVVSVNGGRAPAPCEHFSNVNRGIFVTTQSMVGSKLVGA